MIMIKIMSTGYDSHAIVTTNIDVTCYRYILKLVDKPTHVLWMVDVGRRNPAQHLSSKHGHKKKTQAHKIKK